MSTGSDLRSRVRSSRSRNSTHKALLVTIAINVRAL